MDHMQFFSKRVFELRKQRGLKQKELGEAVGLSYKSISTIESGTNSTTIEKLVALADFFQVSTDYLLGKETSFAQIEQSGFAAFQKLKPEYQEYICKQIDQLLAIQEKETEE